MVVDSMETDHELFHPEREWSSMLKQKWNTLYCDELLLSEHCTMVLNPVNHLDNSKILYRRQTAMLESLDARRNRDSHGKDQKGL